MARNLPILTKILLCLEIVKLRLETKKMTERAVFGFIELNLFQQACNTGENNTLIYICVRLAVDG